jgi:hypothetical protein
VGLDQFTPNAVSACKTLKAWSKGFSLAYMERTRIHKILLVDASTPRYSDALCRFGPQPLNREMPEQKISRVLFPAKGGTMIIYLGPLSPKDSSDLPGGNSPYGERGGQPLPLYAVLLSGGVYPDPCYHGNAWSLTPRFHPWPSPPKAGSGRSVFCGTFRPLRAHELRGTWPWRARTFLPSPAKGGGEAIIYSAPAISTFH